MQLATPDSFKCAALDAPRDGDKWTRLHEFLEPADGYSWDALRASPCAWLNRFFGDADCMRDYAITDLLRASHSECTLALRSSIDGEPYTLLVQRKTKTRNPRKEWQAGRYFQALGWTPTMVCHGSKIYTSRRTNGDAKLHLTVMSHVSGTFRDLLAGIASDTRDKQVALARKHHNVLTSLLKQLQDMFATMTERGVSHNDMTIDNIGYVQEKTGVRPVLFDFSIASLDYADVRNNLAQLVRYLSGPIGLATLKKGALWNFTNDWSKNLIDRVGANERWQRKWVAEDEFAKRHTAKAQAYGLAFDQFVSAIKSFSHATPRSERPAIAKATTKYANAMREYAAFRYAVYAGYTDKTPWARAARWAERQIDYGRTYDDVKREAMPYKAELAAEMHASEDPRRLLAGLTRLLSSDDYYGGGHFEHNVCYMKSAGDGLVPRMLLVWDASAVPDVVDGAHDRDHMDWFFRHNSRGNGNGLYHPLNFMLGDEHYAQQLNAIAMARTRNERSTCSDEEGYLPVIVSYRLTRVPLAVLARFPRALQSRSTVVLVRVGQHAEVRLFEPGMRWPTLLGISQGIRESLIKHVGSDSMAVHAFTSLPPARIPSVTRQPFSVETLWKESALVVQAFPSVHLASWAKLNGTALPSLMFAFCVGTMRSRDDAQMRTLPQVAYAMCMTAPSRDIYKLAVGFYGRLQAWVKGPLAYDTAEATFAIDVCPRFVNADASDVKRFLLLGQDTPADDLDINEELNAAVMPDVGLLRALRGPDQLGIYAPIESLLYPYEIGSADDIKFLSHSQKLVSTPDMQEEVWATLVSSPGIASLVDICGRVPGTRRPLHANFTLADEDTLREAIGSQWDGDMTLLATAMLRLHRKKYPSDSESDGDLAAKIKSPDVHTLKPLPSVTVGYVRDVDQLSVGRNAPASLQWLNKGGLKSAECANKQWLAVSATVQISWLDLTHTVMVLIDRRAGHAYLFDPSGGKQADFGGQAAWAFVVLPSLYRHLLSHGLRPNEWRTTSLVQTEASYGPMVAQLAGTGLQHGQRQCWIWSVLFFHLFLAWGHDISPEEIYRRMLDGFLPQDLGQIVGRYGAWLSKLEYDRVERV
ncbi:hypothetical protein QKT49_gp361 [Acanthamoeba castellanii medusavirus]|uniref:Uncharacterized protein n=1 Tax=Acanthamoeba castellanii medusavirus J1 TaxID=3114988 RepID=A0A3T1CX38_9VIRU|nr:hypothetical protein QKT49_gp361 [Acanthamoeba castellanii medusavirus]BBI30402.1 hypothetical protein [Acanthamoeba castellanii medusavirus J1]